MTQAQNHDILNMVQAYRNTAKITKAQADAKNVSMKKWDQMFGRENAVEKRMDEDDEEEKDAEQIMEVDV